MKESGITRLFILVCIAVLFASYGVGLGVRKIRGVDAQPSAAADTDKPESGDEEVTAKEGDTTEPSEDVVAEPSEEPGEEVAARPERPEGGRRRGGMMGGEGMRERFQNMSDEERQEAMAQMRERFGGGGQRAGRGGGPQLSEEDRENLRAEMEALGANAGDMTDEERQEARRAIFEKYGLPMGRGGGGGRRPGPRE